MPCDDVVCGELLAMGPLYQSLRFYAYEILNIFAGEVTNQKPTLGHWRNGALQNYSHPSLAV
jgi:hypothetical protein